MRVKPIIAGAVICDPETMRQLPDEGGEVQETSYWLRRLNGIGDSAPDVELVAPPITEPEQPAAPAAAPSSPAQE